MRISLLFATASLLTFASCGSDTAAADKKKQDSIADRQQARGLYLANITKAETAMRSDKTYDPKLALEGLKAYTDFTTLYPNDSLTPDFLFKAAQVAQATGNFKQAAIYFETIIEQHKGYKMYVEACFLAANNYDDHLETVDKGAERAKQLYEFIISKYPGSTWAEQSKVLMSYIGKSNEELMNDIIKKNEAKAAK